MDRPPVEISIKDVGKQYLLGQQRAAYDTLRGSLSLAARRATARVLGRAKAERAKGRETFWAVRDVSFDVHQGEVVGVIGRNGAGKSTLLKILARVTEPTTGRVDLYGRAGCLLEVGTGFHPELTGKENVYLNGAILGMPRAEIAAKYDDIVEFAELERFMGTPVKRYSSGMYVRLAFAVAAHLETEILLVDEVLAVGDAEFQAKCLGKIGDVAAHGRTVLFVSHNMSAVRALCGRCVMLRGGTVVMDGEPGQVIEAYLAAGGSSGDVFALPDDETRQESGPVQEEWGKLEGVEWIGEEGCIVQARIHCRINEPIAFNAEWRVITTAGMQVFFGSPEIFRHQRLQADPGSFELLLRVGPLPLAAGGYRLEVALTQAFKRVLGRVHVPFRVDLSDPFGVGFDFKQNASWAPAYGQDEITLEPAASGVLEPDDPDPLAPVVSDG